MQTSGRVPFFTWLGMLVQLVTEFIPDLIFPDRWIPKVLETGVQATGKVMRR